jgi:broad specificity phosphatase PhoE
MASTRQRIFLIRHGETEFNRMGVFRGRYEVGLNERGRSQAGEIARSLKVEDIGFLISGPLSRARETAGIIAEELAIQYRIDQAFDNIDLGSWQGVPKDRVQREYPELWRRWTMEPERLRVPGGETVEEVRERAFKGLEDVLSHERRSFGIVTHRSVLKGLAASILNVPAPWFWKFYIDNAAYSIFEYDQSGYTLVKWNSNAHLSERVEEIF